MRVPVSCIYRLVRGFKPCECLSEESGKAAYRTREGDSGSRIIEMNKKKGGGGMAYKPELWAEAKKKCRLNEEEIRMAKEMGLNPKSLIKNIPSPREQWKQPVKVWIHEMYEDRYGKKKNKAASS